MNPVTGPGSAHRNQMHPPVRAWLTLGSPLSPSSSSHKDQPALIKPWQEKSRKTIFDHEEIAILLPYELSEETQGELTLSKAVVGSTCSKWVIRNKKLWSLTGIFAGHLVFSHHCLIWHIPGTIQSASWMTSLRLIWEKTSFISISTCRVVQSGWTLKKQQTTIWTHRVVLWEYSFLRIINTVVSMLNLPCLVLQPLMFCRLQTWAYSVNTQGSFGKEKHMS